LTDNINNKTKVKQMNKHTNTEVTKCQRRYPSGILMYRERKERFVVPANTSVKIIKHGPKQTLVALPAKEFNGWFTMIPNEALPAFRAPAKTTKGKKAPVVAAENEAAPAAPVIEGQAEQQAPVEAAQAPVEAAI
jgi:hypothetical protein